MYTFLSYVWKSKTNNRHEMKLVQTGLNISSKLHNTLYTFAVLDRDGQLV